MGALKPFLAAGLLFLLVSDATAATAGGKWDEDELVFFVPITLMICVFGFLTLRYYFESRVYRAAIEAGQPIPQKSQTDPRKAALILIAIGLGYGVSAYVATRSHTPDALGFAIWGLIPVLIGVGLWLYYRMTDNEKEDEEKV